MIEPDKVRTWMDQVRSEESSAEDYDFLDELTHGGPGNNGSNGLANVGAYLAIYEKDGDIKVDEGLVDALDRKQSEESVGKRFRNIVYDAQTSKREGNTLYDRKVDGHNFLEEMLTEFEDRADLDSLPIDDENIFKDATQNQSSNNKQGGDNNMTNYQGRNFWEDVKRGMEDLDDDLDDLADYVENGDYDDAVDTMVDAVNQVGGYDEARSTAESIAEYLDAVDDDVNDVYGELDAHRQTLEQAAQDLEDVGFRQDELDSMSDIQQHVANR